MCVFPLWISALMIIVRQRNSPVLSLLPPRYRVITSLPSHHHGNLQCKDWRILRYRELEFLAHSRRACARQHPTTLLSLSYSHLGLETGSENTS